MTSITLETTKTAMADIYHIPEAMIKSFTLQFLGVQWREQKNKRQPLARWGCFQWDVQLKYLFHILNNLNGLQYSVIVVFCRSCNPGAIAEKWIAPELHPRCSHGILIFCRILQHMAGAWTSSNQSPTSMVCSLAETRFSCVLCCIQVS